MVLKPGGENEAGLELETVPREGATESEHVLDALPQKGTTNLTMRGPDWPLRERP